MTALNNALANGPANGFVYPEQRPLQTMKFWPDLQKLSVDGDEILAAAVLDGGTIYWCARPCRHHHIIAAKWRTDEKGFSQEYVHGFLTKNGRFLDRAEAHQMWFFCPGELTTEQLW